MGLSARTPVTGLLALVGCLALFGCRSSDDGPLVQLTVRYQQTPARLRVSGSAQGERSFGPTLLPDPARLGQFVVSDYLSRRGGGAGRRAG